MTKRKNTNSSKADNALVVQKADGDSSEKAVAQTILRPSVQAAITLQNIASNSKDTSLLALMDELSAQCSKAISGDLGRGEAMLMAQAHTLDTVFNRLLLRAVANQGEYLDAADRYYRLALRAQNQCRATIETLAAIKNPPHLAFVKQANIGQAVQVNNAPQSTSRAPEMQNEPNKLLEVNDGKRLESAAPAATGGANSEMETVGTIDRTENRRR